jgi:hypothetical protein
MLAKVSDAMGQDQSPALLCLGVVFLGMAPMYDQDGLIESPQKVLTIRFDLKPIDHPPTAISDHSVKGDDRIPFDAQLPEHLRNSLCRPRQRLVMERQWLAHVP